MYFYRFSITGYHFYLKSSHTSLTWLRIYAIKQCLNYSCMTHTLKGSKEGHSLSVSKIWVTRRCNTIFDVAYKQHKYTECTRFKRWHKKWCSANSPLWAHCFFFQKECVQCERCQINDRFLPGDTVSLHAWTHSNRQFRDFFLFSYMSKIFLANFFKTIFISTTNFLLTVLSMVE